MDINNYYYTDPIAAAPRAVVTSRTKCASAGKAFETAAGYERRRDGDLGGLRSVCCHYITSSASSSRATTRFAK